MATLAAMLLLALVIANDAFAQANPFGPSRFGVAAPPTAGTIGWLLERQAMFYRQMAGLLRTARADGTAVIGLFGVSFLYGIFHAAGPGHGKAVISSYLIANQETWRRGIVLSFTAALLQAFVAVAIVGVAAILFAVTRGSICEIDRLSELGSYSLIVLIGARLSWTTGRHLIRSLRNLRRASPAEAHRDYAHMHHQHTVHERCAHGHGPDVETLIGPGGWRRGLIATIAVGVRPCSGALLVLVFALAQGLFWAGAAATVVMAVGTAITVAVIATIALSARNLAKKFVADGGGVGTVGMKGIEFGAAALILVFGLMLFCGSLITERLAGLC